MARRKTRTLTKVELEFMQIIWKRREVTTEDILEELAAKGRHLSDGAIRRMLAILVEKGFLTRRREGMAFIYKPAVNEEQATKKIAKDLLERAFRGKASLLVAALLDSRSINRKDMEKIKKLISDREKEGAG